MKLSCRGFFTLVKTENLRLNKKSFNQLILLNFDNENSIKSRFLFDRRRLCAFAFAEMILTFGDYKFTIIYEK